MDIANYFDNAATTPLDRRALDAMLPYFSEHPGNANSLHAWGREAMAGVEKAREQVASLIGAEDPAEIVFTSGATESNNWILRSFPQVAVSPFEHSSAFETAKHLGLKILDNRGTHTELCATADLMSLMKVNNEIGTIFEPEALNVEPAKVHSDITQAVGKIDLQVANLDFASFSAHKFYGPKGVGALYAKGGNFPAPLLFGGEHEYGMRAGTLNVPGIVGMGAAAEVAVNERDENFVKAKAFREIVLEGLEKTLEYRVNGGPNVSPYILSISFRGVEGETLVIEMDRLGFAISSGAACSSRSTEPSHVLVALRVEPEWLRGTVRISFGRFNTKEAAHDLSINLSRAVKSVTKLG